MSKKVRGPNFSSNEKEILIHLITKYKDLVENKKTDAVTTATKNEGWRKVTQEFNSLSSFSDRNTDQLKTCWDNIKRYTRKDKARTKKEIILTGGGRPNLPPTGSFQGQVEVILGPTLSGLENPFDSDAQYTEQGYVSPISIDNVIEAAENSDILPSGISTLREDGLKLVAENEPVAGPSTISKPDEWFQVVQENEPTTARPSQTSQSREDENLIMVPEDKDTKKWNGWSPAALKTKVSNNLTINKKDHPSPSWLQRRRPKASLHDKLLESKLELVELMKKNAQTEANIKQLILEEQLKQEKLKTETLELQLKEAEQNNLRKKLILED